MTEADLEAVLSIERHAYRYPWSEMIFRDCLRVGYGCFVHEVDQIVGHLVVSCAAGEAHILNICIAPPWQRQGIAHHLLNVAVERAQLLAAQMLFLEVRPSNVPACRLYQQFGFNEVGRRPGYYPAPHGREDALIMAREVAF
ncbi:ribosomal protein S18-alanine N-acetyltransferase [Halorhodospira halochloris]|nr:ribosomal protein S18-alanine N-acetyltransferase [Halorhodospira halochloris]MCG5530992.1 ribosomal protein S18-alanine N-acetyltransferase [Halorhodospira halochloris]MCG5548773.1 ribosomal protein S18-alanine N-acetyltransferase [Halorhodospira halochloris]